MPASDVIVATSFDLIAAKFAEIEGEVIHLEVDSPGWPDGPVSRKALDVEGTVGATTLGTEEVGAGLWRHLSVPVGNAVVHFPEAGMEEGSWNRLEGAIQFRCNGMVVRIDGAASALRDF